MQTNLKCELNIAHFLKEEIIKCSQDESPDTGASIFFKANSKEFQNFVTMKDAISEATIAVRKTLSTNSFLFLNEVDLNDIFLPGSEYGSVARYIRGDFHRPSNYLDNAFILIPQQTVQAVLPDRLNELKQDSQVIHFCRPIDLGILEKIQERKNQPLPLHINGPVGIGKSRSLAAAVFRLSENRNNIVVYFPDAVTLMNLEIHELIMEILNQFCFSFFEYPFIVEHLVKMYTEISTEYVISDYLLEHFVIEIYQTISRHLLKVKFFYLVIDQTDAFSPSATNFHKINQKDDRNKFLNSELFGYLVKTFSNYIKTGRVVTCSPNISEPPFLKGSDFFLFDFPREFYQLTRKETFDFVHVMNAFKRDSGFSEFEIERIFTETSGHFLTLFQRLTACSRNIFEMETRDSIEYYLERRLKEYKALLGAGCSATQRSKKLKAGINIDMSALAGRPLTEEEYLDGKLDFDRRSIYVKDCSEDEKECPMKIGKTGAQRNHFLAPK